MSGMPRHDTRIVLQKFNEQMEPLFNLLREVRIRVFVVSFGDIFFAFFVYSLIYFIVWKWIVSFADVFVISFSEPFCRLAQPGEDS